MSANAGRGAVLYWGDESPQPAVAGIDEWTVTMNGEAIDTTNNDSGGKRELLATEGVQSVDIQASGVVKDDTLRADKANGNTQQDLTFVWPDGAQITGKFHLQTYNDGGPDEDKVSFQANFMSAGSYTYTEAP